MYQTWQAGEHDLNLFLVQLPKQAKPTVGARPLLLPNTCRTHTKPYNRTPSMHTPADIPLLITSENSSSSERRVTPSWSISHLKARLEPITGIPASCQRLSLRIASQAPQAIEAQDEDVTQLSNWPLHTYAEIYVSDCLLWIIVVEAFSLFVRLWAVMGMRHQHNRAITCFTAIPHR